MGVLDRILRPTSSRVAPAPRQTRAARPITIGPDGKLTSSPVSSDPTASAIVYRCVQTIATNAAALDLVVRDQNGEARADHPISLLFNRRPNPTYSARILKEVVWAQLELAGQAFLYLDRGPTGDGTIAEMWPVYDRVQPVIDSTADRPLAGTVVGYLAHQGARRIGLLPSEVLWLRYPHPTTPWGALSPLRAASFAADLDAYAKTWQAGELRNGPGSNQIIFLGDLEEDQFHQTVAALRGQTDGPRNARRNAFTSGTVKPEAVRLGLTAAEASYIESRKINADEIALAFGVPRDLLFGQSTYDNQRAAKVNLWSDTLVPKLEVVAGEVDRQLLPDLAESAEFDVSQVEALQENQDAIYNRVRGLVYTDVPTIDEARLLVGLEPLPGGLGALTITAYRETVRAQILQQYPAQQAAVRAAVLPDVLPARDTVRALPAAPETRARRTVAVDAKAVQRQYDRMETVGRRAVQRLAERQQTKVLKNAERRAAGALQTRATPDELFDRPYWTDQTREALGGFLAQVYDGGAAQTASALGLDFDLFDPAVTAAMTARLDVLADQITQTTSDAIERALLEPGVEAGESVPDLAARLLAVFTDLETWRAETIARTETVGGHNEASSIAATASGLVAARQWLATEDTRVRDSHRELDGYTTQGMDDAYPNGLRFPGDPTGPPAETINCRCVEMYVLPDDDEDQ